MAGTTTYLFGAGASAQSLPVVNNMEDRIEKCIEWLRAEFFKLYPLNLEDSKLRLVIDDLKWLKEACQKNNFSIDTYASQLRHQKDFRNYEKLKILLSLYFTIEQKRVPLDPRYLNFWNNILKAPGEFPKDIRILSWNYDFQLELSYQAYSREQSLKQSADTLNISSIESHLKYANESQRFGIFKINGSATFELENGRGKEYFIEELRTCNMSAFFDELFLNFEIVMSPRNKYKNHLSFAWDNSSENNPFFENLKSSVEYTRTLIVVGYSFPETNHKVDSLIINRYMPNLQDVYIQCNPGDKETLEERFLDLTDSQLIPEFRKNIGKFHVPNYLIV